MLGWNDAGAEFVKLYHNDVRKHLITADAPIIISTWIPGAATEFYLARRTGQIVLGVGGVDSLHQYYFANKSKKLLQYGDDAYYIFVSNHFDPNMINFLSNHFQTAVNPLSIPIYRNNLLCKEMYVFRLIHYDGRPFK